MNDRLSDMITRIRNAYLAGKKEVIMPHTNLLESVAQVMATEKYLDQVTIQQDGNHKNLALTLLYHENRPAITKMKRVSKPGVRIYHSKKHFAPILSGLGIAIVSTSQGVMTTSQARQNQLGGEVLVELW